MQCFSRIDHKEKFGTSSRTFLLSIVNLLLLYVSAFWEINLHYHNNVIQLRWYSFYGIKLPEISLSNHIFFVVNSIASYLDYIWKSKRKPPAMQFTWPIYWKSSSWLIVNPSRPDPGRGEINNLDIFFAFFCGASKGFWGLHKTFWDTKKKCADKYLSWFLF